MGVDTRHPRRPVCFSSHPSFAFLGLAPRLFQVFCAVLALVFSAPAPAAEVTLAWDQVTDPRVQLYEVHYGPLSGQYDEKVTSQATSATVSNLTPGRTYYFAVRACDAAGTLCGGFSDEISAVIPAAAPVADFSVSHESGTPPLVVTFTDASSGAITGRQWEFGDGATSTDPSPSHKYQTADTFTATLTVTGPGGSTTKSAVITVNAAPPVPGFVASPTSGFAPLEVAFNDTSAGEITDRQWHFGDGATSTDPSPSHTYLMPGPYAVTLVVTGPGGSAVETANIAVITPPPQAAFSASVPSEAAPLNLAFTDSSVGTITSWSWTFGDGTTSSSKSPNHSYAMPGTYTASLTVVGPGGTDTATQELSVGEDFPMETGEVTINHEWQRVNFQSKFRDPIVVVGPLSANGGDPAVVRVKDIDAGGFSVRVQEWGYLDGRHENETVAYLVTERGRHSLPGGSWIEANRVNTDATDAFVYVPFEEPYSDTPVVLASVTSVNEEDAVTTRLRRIDGEGFQVGMREAESNLQLHAEETIDYIAWQLSSGGVNNMRFEVGRTGDEVTDRPYTLTYPMPLRVPPLLLMHMQGTDGGDTANLRWKNRGTERVQLWVDEEQSRDRETKHTTETVGYVLMTPID